jgi:hypothetical protein
MGSVQPWAARSNSPQWSGSMVLPRTRAWARTACSGPRCQSGQARS